MPTFIEKFDQINLVQEINQDLVSDLIAKKDELIKTLLNAYLGRDDWTVEELKGRVHAFSLATASPGKRAETYVIDDVKLITFFEPRIERVLSDMYCEQRYQVHYQPEQHKSDT